MKEKIQKKLPQNITIDNLKIIIVDDVYTTGSTMKNVVEMIEKNILEKIRKIEEKEKRLNIEYIFFSLAKD